MEVCKFPDLDAHRSMHSRLTETVIGLTKRWQEERSPDLIDELRSFLGKWLFEHITKEDRKITPCVEGKKQEVALALKMIA